MTTQRKAYWALAVTSTVWGTSWLASRYAVQFAPPLQVSAIRQCIAGSLFVGFFLLKGERLPQPKQLLAMAGMSILLFVFANGLATVGVKYISGGLGALIAALYPLSVVLMEKIIFRNRRIAALTWFGILLGFAGIVMVFYDNAFHHPAADYWKGVAFSLVAMLSWGAGTLLIARKPIQGVNPYFTMGWEMLFASFFLFVMAKATGPTLALQDIPLPTWKAIAYLVIMGSLVAVVAFVFTMKHLEPSIAALYAYINPIVAMVIGAFLVHEPLTPLIGVGALITLTGVYLVNRSLRSKTA